MISADTIRELEDRGLEYILGGRLRQQREGRDLLWGWPGRYREVADNFRGQEVWGKGDTSGAIISKRRAKDAAIGRPSSRPSPTLYPRENVLPKDICLM